MVLAVVFVMATLAVLGTTSAVAATIDETTLHPYLAFFIRGARYIFTATPVAVLIGFGSSLLGFGINWLRAKRTNTPTTDFSLTWLGQTIVTFEAWVLLVTPLINVVVQIMPEAYRADALIVTAAVWAIINLLISELKRILAAAKTTATVQPPKTTVG